MYRFPGRALLDRLLVLPLAMPTYIVAYRLRRAARLRRPGAERPARAVRLADAARLLVPRRPLARRRRVRALGRALPVCLSLGAGELRAAVGVRARGGAHARAARRSAPSASVALPLARPALAAGVALALMECLNDLGAVQYLGVETLTASVYTTWLQRSNLGGAAQIAAVCCCSSCALLFAASARRAAAAAFHHTTGRYRAIPFQDLDGWRGCAGRGALRAAVPARLRAAVPGAAQACRAHAAATRCRRRLSGAPCATASCWPRSAARSTVAVALAARLCAARRRQRLHRGRRCGSPGSAMRCPAPCWRSAC